MNPFRRTKRVSQPSVEAVPIAQDSLMELCQGDNKLHEALSHFLLVRPEEQLPLLGTPEVLTQSAFIALGKGDSLTARVDLETAARIEMYKQDIEKVRMSLERAQKLHGEGGEEYRATLLSNLERAMGIAAQYYHQISRPKAEENPLLVMS